MNQTTNKREDSSLRREQILTAAMEVLSQRGLKGLSQAKVATRAGMRQSHLTYYFPKRADLLAGLLQWHIDKAAAGLADIAPNEKPANIERALQVLCSDVPRMRFFLSLLLEAEQDDQLKRQLAIHLQQFNTLVARYFGRPADDPQVTAFLNTLRGYGMANMVLEQPLSSEAIEQLARVFELA